MKEEDDKKEEQDIVAPPLFVKAALRSIDRVTLSFLGPAEKLLVFGGSVAPPLKVPYNLVWNGGVGKKQNTGPIKLGTLNLKKQKTRVEVILY